MDDVNSINFEGHKGGTIALSSFDKFVVSIGSFEIKVWELPEISHLF